MQKSLRCKDSRLGFGILILFGISLVIPKFRITRLSALQDLEKDSEIHAALSSLNWPAWLKPEASYLLFENVPGLLSHDGGRTFATILNTLDRLGYGVEWQCLNSKDFGVPQSRNRVYIVGYLDERCRGKVFPFTETAGSSLIQTHGGHQGSASTPPKD